MASDTTKHEQILEELESDPGLRGRDYFYVHRNRYKSDLKNVERRYKGGKVLEIGAYPLHMTYCLKRLGLQAISLDIDPRRGEEFIHKHDLVVKRCNIETEPLPFDDNTIDLLLLHEIFEHLRINPIATLRELNRVLKPNGTMILTTPNLYALHTIILFLIGQGLYKPYREFSKLYDVGHMGHIREYSTKEMKIFLTNTGFKIIDVRYAHYKGYFRTGNKALDMFIHFCFRSAPPFWRPFQVIISKK